MSQNTPTPAIDRASLIVRDKKFVWHPYTPMRQYIDEGEPLVIARASGSHLYDVDGRSFIDGNASWWTSLLGHNHPRLVQALTRQAEVLCHTSLAGVTHAPAVDFAEALVSCAPPGLSRVFFSDNGSTAVEAALKQAVQFWAQEGAPKKSEFLALADAFHGETMGVTSLGGVEAFRRPFSELTFPVRHLPSPADGLEHALEALREALVSHGDTIAARVIEPLIQGAGGMRMYAPDYLKAARELTEEHDVLLIVDEVFTGYGRTGPMWACETAGICPDILATAKGLSGGLLPFAATLSTERIFEAFLGDPSKAFYYGHTYCGNPLGAAVASEVLSVYQDENILAEAAPTAQLLAATFHQFGEMPGVTNVRSQGMCAALDLAPASGGGYLERAGWKVYEAALRRGAYIRPLGNVVYLTPALNIGQEALTTLLQALEESLIEVLAV